jgi:N-acetylmuramoyl-L-alanine amidase
MFSIRGLLAALIVIAVGCLGGMAARAATELAVTGLRIVPAGTVGSGERTRVTIELTGKAEIRVFPLADPYRVVIDLPQVAWRLQTPEAARRGGPISGLRYGQFQPGTSRLVLDLAQPALIARATYQAPAGKEGHRVLVELAAAGREAFLEAVRQALAQRSQTTQPVPPPRPPETAEPKRRADGKRVIAIDPGHGGVDPGAIASSGIYEKDLTLTYARELRRVLQATGRYHVVLTRERDSFVALRERIRIARAASAELFISLHADAISDPDFRGGSVYTLSERASDAEAEALAAKENKADVIAGLDLSEEAPQITNILIDLARRETMNGSARFALALIPELAQETRMLRTNRRFAGFAVLKAPDVPSVLIELGYLSNAEDERLLRQEKHRQRVAQAIQRAIDSYFKKGAALKRS